MMKNFLLLFAYLCIPGINSMAQSMVLQNVSVLPMTESELVLSARDVWIADGKIQGIFTTGSQEIPAGYEILDGTDHYLMPGLSEMHAHIPVPQEGEDDTYVRETMLLYLANGVTMIRGMLGDPYHLELKSQFEDNEILAPRIYTSSPSMNGGSVPTVDIAREKVLSARSAGYDFLKIHPGIKLDVMQALVSTAREAGIRYAGHVPAEVGIERALKFGYWSVDHADGYIQGLVRDGAEYDPDNVGFFGSALVDLLDWDKMERLAGMTRDSEVWIVPTQTLFTRWFSPTPVEEMMAADEMDYLPAATRYNWTANKTRVLGDPEYSTENFENFLKSRQRILRMLYESGAGLLLGSDSPQVMNVPGFSIHHEISSLLDAGLPIGGILESGTKNPAIFFNQEGRYGTIVQGADADVILLTGNPLEDVSALKKPALVCVRGNCRDRLFFEMKLKEIKERHKS